LYVVGKGTKSRWVAILPSVVRLLCDLHGQEGPNARCHQPLVMNHFGQAYTRFGLGKMVRRLCAEAGLRQVVSPHALRRTHATLALKGGASLQDIQLTLGHARLETTTRYVQYEGGLQRSTAQCLPSLGV
jgi:integrase/recombinase XerD